MYMGLCLSNLSKGVSIPQSLVVAKKILESRKYGMVSSILPGTTSECMQSIANALMELSKVTNKDYDKKYEGNFFTSRESFITGFQLLIQLCKDAYNPMPLDVFEVFLSHSIGEVL